ncbi:MAG: hypothetical protein GF417_13275 [Candidatus Latescibacteria bacterium]|nr:hypothetical protein [bacterium]MBD3425399.1 hypothetical protein [Candidatus Latescibacterota bacterium]
MKRKNRIWIGFLLIFLFGAAVGIAGTAFFVRSHIHSFIKGGPPSVNSRIIRRILHDIEMNESQRKEIDRIMREFEPEIEELSSNFGRSMREVTDRQIERIKEVLSPGQRDIVEERFKRLKEHFRKTFHERKESRRAPSHDFKHHRHTDPRDNEPRDTIPRP